MSKRGKGPKKGGKKKDDEKYKDIDDSVGDDSGDDLDDIIDDIEEDWDNLGFDDMTDDDLVWENFDEGGDEGSEVLEGEKGDKSPARKVIESLKARGSLGSEVDDVDPMLADIPVDAFPGDADPQSFLSSDLETREVIADIPSFTTDELLSQISERIISEVEQKTKEIENNLKAASAKKESEFDQEKIMTLLEEKIKEQIKVIEEKITSSREEAENSSQEKLSQLKASIEPEIKNINSGIDSLKKDLGKTPEKEEMISFLEEKVAEQEKILIKLMESGISEALSKVELIKGVTDTVTREALLNSQTNFERALTKATQAEKQSTEVISRIGFAIVEAQRASSTAGEASSKMDEVTDNVNKAFAKTEEVLKHLEENKKELSEILKNAQNILSAVEESATAETNKILKLSEETGEKVDKASKKTDEACKRGEELAIKLEEISKTASEANDTALKASKEVAQMKKDMDKTYAKSKEFKSILDKHLLKSEKAFAKAKTSEEKANTALTTLSDVMSKVETAAATSKEVLDKMAPFEERFSEIKVATDELDERVSKASKEVIDTEKKLEKAGNKFNEILSKSDRSLEQARSANEQFDKLNKSTESALEKSEKALEILNTLTERIDKTGINVDKVENKSEVLLEMALQKAKAIDVPEEVFEKVNKASEEAEKLIARIDEIKSETGDIDKKIEEALSKIPQKVPSPVIAPVVSAPQEEDIEIPEESDLPLDLDDLLQVLVEHKASDLHLKVGSPPYVRLEGSLIPVGAQALTDRDTLRLVAGVMDKSLRAKFKKNRTLSFSYGVSGGMRFRVNAFYERSMVSAAIKMLNVDIPTFEKLNLPSDLLDKICELKSGLVLFAGPISSGKSTMVASIVNHINQSKKMHIITVENSIDILYSDRKSIISQREVGTDTLSFSKALNEALKQDPDIIIVDEVTDSGAFELMNLSAEAGKLIFGIVRSNLSVQAIERLMQSYTGRDKKYFHYLFANNLKLIVSQKLIRTDKADSLPVLEIIWNNPQLKNFIAKGSYNEIYSLIGDSGQEGIQNFSDSLNKLVKAGNITPEEALKYKDIVSPKVDMSDPNSSEESMLSWL